MSEPNNPKGSGKEPANWKIPDRVNDPHAEVGVPSNESPTPSFKGGSGMSRRSKIVTAGVISTLVGGGLYGLSALGNSDNKNQNADNRRCVDNNNVVVSDSQCSTGGGGHYYYGGFGGFFPGSVVSGGSTSRPNNNSTVSRGGIGSGSDTSKATSSAGS